jgi:hypothetical protein
MRRRGALLLVGWAAGCATGPRELPGPSTVEGPPRRFLVLELLRRAHVPVSPDSAETRSGPAVAVAACRWHVNPEGALYGDHWGWCEDFKILPRASPGYLLLTTLFSGGASGGYGRLIVLPPPPGALEAFGRRVTLHPADGTPQGPSDAVRLEFGAETVTVAPGQSAPLGGERASIEPPEETGHFESGYDQPMAADVAYAAVHHGWLDSRRIAGRAPRGG